MNKIENDIYDVIVIGAGHAGCEAALASARKGAKTLLLTMNMDHIAQMSCNPAIGGIAKGHVVREIDALGGAMGRVTDASTIQFRMLNPSKGPAVWSPRSQCDKQTYQRAMKFELEKADNLDIKQAEVEKFIIENGELVGIRTQFTDILSKAFVVTTGTFLSGKLHYGLKDFPGGRAGDPASFELAKSFVDDLELKVGRLKTGTPPRILDKSINFDELEPQNAEFADEYFSFYDQSSVEPKAIKKDMPCYTVYSTQKTADIVNANLEKAPLYQGKIEGIGARYCPSFEDKVVRFPHHERHLLHLEPEGEYTGEYYINGISTSLPPEVQEEMIKSVLGLENAVISRYAYAIEYDFIYPDQIERSMRVKKWNNLFLAGQINGTSGYEEAGAQGLIAGMNAAKTANNEAIVELARDTSYIGVLLDDIVTKEIIEPYRLFTSRAEYRLRLRQDNADLRLSQFAYDNGLLSQEKYDKFKKYEAKICEVRNLLKSQREQGKTLWTKLKDLNGKTNNEIPDTWENIPLDLTQREDRRIYNQVVIECHYEGYLKREDKTAKKLQELEKWKIPSDFDYEPIKGMRNEARAKLIKVAPTTLSQASRIDGVTPAEIALLQIHLKRHLQMKN